MTGQALFYLGEQDLRHKVLAIVEQAGAERAAYALKLLQSEGELTIASTGKDPETGKLVTHEYRVEGPVAVFLTTTAATIDEELVNRALVLTVDEDREQTRAIHRRQREAQTLEGLLARQGRDARLRVHQNAQRLLRPLLVANPYARQLTFLDHRTRTRRDHGKYLTLIRAIALLHQYQRPIRTVLHQGQPVDYVEVTRADIATANRLAHEVLGRSLDELAPQTRRLLGRLDAMAREVTAQAGSSARSTASRGRTSAISPGGATSRCASISSACSTSSTSSRIAAAAARASSTSSSTMAKARTARRFSRGYSTSRTCAPSVRRMLWGVEDVDMGRGTVTVRQGKGKKDRVVPSGERALAWCRRYLAELRPTLVSEPDHGVLFVAKDGGGPMSVHALTERVSRFVERAGIRQYGACHLFRHTMATLMLARTAPTSASSRRSSATRICRRRRSTRTCRSER
jgi:hypothetical protein